MAAISTSEETLNVVKKALSKYANPVPSLSSNQVFQASEFSFEYFRTEIFLLISPDNKMKLNTNTDKNTLVALLRDAIISNFGFNPYFYKFDFKREELAKLHKILVNSANLVLSHNQIVQLIFLVHLSKANINDKNAWNYFFLHLETINVIEINDFLMVKELNEFLQQLKNCKKFTDKILDVAQEISGIEKIETDFSNFEINFISSLLPGLNGFSGINSIYINLTELTRKYNELKVSLDEARALNVLKLECLIPKLAKISATSSLPEAGISAEENIFSHPIDWITSIIIFNYDYCIDYLTNLLNNEDVNFDFKKANFTIEK
ncbi:hypothetical protein BpHYR1_014219 [Brachionus plicatilis]|uniref:Uncharacterized protein n=1 Tax=Brachionus plicatilis TaxID=10195 RepID=A0A3M7SC43_BRAPC|nr:hypothetical protein BpHYR1_014219 [Brachionus plicatilis]